LKLADNTKECQYIEKEAIFMFGLTPFNKSLARRDDDLSDFFDDFFSDRFSPLRSLRRDTFKLDVKDEGKEFVVEAEMPGIKKSEIEIHMNDGYLMIEVTKEETKNEENKNYVHRERIFTKMQRSIHLGDINQDKIEANLKDGILTIKAPKQDQIETKKRIEIK
jgi:HSP20 family protein